MPHLALEYSANLEGKADIAGLCRALHAAVMASGLFEPGAVRVRAFAARHYAIADLDPRNSFIDMSFRIGEGRAPVDGAIAALSSNHFRAALSTST